MACRLDAPGAPAGRRGRARPTKSAGCVRRGLGELRGDSALRRPAPRARVEDLAQVQAQLAAAEPRRRLSTWRRKTGSGLYRPASHVHVLRAPSGEEERDTTRAPRGAAPVATAVGRALHEQAQCVVAVARDERAAVSETRRPSLEREGDVGQVGLGMALEVVAQRSRSPRRAAARERADSTRSCSARAAAGAGRRRRFFEHDVRVRAADAERAEAGARAGFVLPARASGVRVHVERTLLEAELGFGDWKCRRRRDRLVLERERRLDQAGHARGGIEVADVRLERAERAEAAVRRSCGGRPASAPPPRSGSPSAVPVPCAST